jgi:hypothetical protein
MTSERLLRTIHACREPPIDAGARQARPARETLVPYAFNATYIGLGWSVWLGKPENLLVQRRKTKPLSNGITAGE